MHQRQMPCGTDGALWTRLTLAGRVKRMILLLLPVSLRWGQEASSLPGRAETAADCSCLSVKLAPHTFPVYLPILQLVSL